MKHGRAGLRLFTGLLFAGFLFHSAPARATSLPWINEIHYDNMDVDMNEHIEVAGPAGLDLAGYELILYNGNNRARYSTTPLTGVIPDLQNGFGVVNFAYPQNGIQNGSPDGVVLYSGSAVVQFLSYEGPFTAADGPAAGMTSVDIGVAEHGDRPIGYSLQLTGTGNQYNDFLWCEGLVTSDGQINRLQYFTAVPDAGHTSGLLGMGLAVLLVARRRRTRAGAVGNRHEAIA